MQQDFRVFCDMDGVLTDFDKGFTQINSENLTPDEYEARYGKSSIWPIISKMGSSFWANLDWMPDGRELWSYLQQYNPTILSSPSRDYSSIRGKMEWIIKNLGISQSMPTTKSRDWDKDTRIILSQHKHLYVLPGVQCILIDDTRSKIEKWETAGGIGILHTSASNTISKLNDILK